MSSIFRFFGDFINIFLAESDWGFFVLSIFLGFILFFIVRYLKIIKNYLDITKPANRLEWWVGAAPTLFILVMNLFENAFAYSGSSSLYVTLMNTVMGSGLLTFLHQLFFMTVFGGGLLSLVFLFPLCVYFIVTIRRYKSLNKGGVWSLIVFIPFGFIFQAVQLGLRKPVE